MRPLRNLTLIGLVATLAVAGCGVAEQPQVLQVLEQTSSTPPSPTTAPADGSPTVQAAPEQRAAELPDADEIVAAVRSVLGSARVGVLVVDRDTGADLVAVEAERQFRSASLVKLMIAVDVLADGPTAATRKRISAMLTASDDDIATSLWVRQGGTDLLTRSTRRMGLTGTEPPAIVGRWGDVLLTARDVAKVYDYVLDELPADDRALIVDSLAASTPTAADGFDQTFGIPSGISAEWAVKQGWSDSTNDIVVHSTGLVGDHWRYMVVLLTEYPLGTRWANARKAVTAGAAVLDPYLS
ncbi:hypothetical protein [Actinokineospora globicatena]|uniref:hypothetical protein n=1 Tax=Actinokineospora globicatena TaxID=103729 RepID=UPI0020A2C70D|nr:hypothetical protein [Actinokineospora globicatena]MCP2305139.1 hypothetical protein [Actinokineospora globicatena]GLW80606.1 hypothetical protein Aglo01_50870 [Actinokineospora globicatena]GLW87434.1 hypothetical protein Aglo02_50730 [Actinokineospora globicatena]